MENQKKTTNSLARRMGISLICGLAAGLLLMMLRENLNSSGQEAVWKTINSILFQDITAAGTEKDLGLFYILGQLFIRSLQLMIVPMVFTSITLAIGQGFPLRPSADSWYARQWPWSWHAEPDI